MNKTVKFCFIEEIGNTNKLVDRHTNKQVERQTNKQTNKQANKSEKNISSQSKYISDAYLSLL